MAGRAKPPQQKRCPSQKLQGKPCGQWGDQPGRACLCQPCSSLPARHTERHGRGSRRHVACRSGSLYLVTSNKRKVAVGRVSSLLYACCVGAPPCSWGKAPGESWGLWLRQGSPCRARGASRPVKPTQDHAVSMPFRAPRFLGATLKSPPSAGRGDGLNVLPCTSCTAKACPQPLWQVPGKRSGAPWHQGSKGWRPGSVLPCSQETSLCNSSDSSRPHGRLKLQLRSAPSTRAVALLPTRGGWAARTKEMQPPPRSLGTLCHHQHGQTPAQGRGTGSWRLKR